MSQSALSIHTPSQTGPRTQVDGRVVALRECNSASAQPAITVRILRQVLLVIFLRVVELRRLADFGGDRGAMRLAERFLVAALALFRRLLLRVGGEVDGRAVLRADVIALAHALGRIV